MNKQIVVFEKYSWEEKIHFFESFYSSMIDKTSDQAIKARFKSKLEKMSKYQESSENNRVLYEEFKFIQSAKEESKRRKLEDIEVNSKKAKIMKDELEKFESNEQDPDEYLIQQLMIV